MNRRKDSQINIYHIKALVTILFCFLFYHHETFCKEDNNSSFLLSIAFRKYNYFGIEEKEVMLFRNTVLLLPLAIIS